MEILLPEQTTVDDIIFWTTELSNPPMEILLPEQTTVDDIIFWTTELSNPENEKIARVEGDANLSQRQAGDILCGSCG